MTNVVTISGTELEPGKPNQDIVDAIKNVLELAESGQLQSFIGTGFTNDGLRMAVWCDYHQDVYQQLGALAWLQHEYVARQT